MKFFEKMTSVFKNEAGHTEKSRIFKIVGLIALGFGSVSAMVTATIAWFNMGSKDSKIKMVSGDLGVEIQKVTAYKYVYPYYKNSTEFIDYDGQGTIKPYVIEDHTIEYDSQKIDDIAFGHDDAVVTLGEATLGTYSTDASAAHSSSNIYFSNDSDFRYYLIGDATFSGDASNEWSSKSAIALKNNGAVANNNPAIASDIVVSAGSSFILFDKQGAAAGSCYYFPYSSINYNDTPFRIDNGKLFCLRSGIYTFTYVPGSLNITLTTNGGQKDIASIGNNSLDPTKVTIDYAGSADKETYPTINDYLPQAIFDQNTMLILDVEIKYTNANPIDAGLKIERSDANSVSIYNDTNKYDNTSKNNTGYVDNQHRNALNASDFYTYYAVFTKAPFTANDPADVPQAIWDGMHRQSDSNFSKFDNVTDYDVSIDCTLNLKEQSDSLLVPGNITNNIYHCYIGIDYDSIYTRYFLYESRLGKTYLLDRDFGFHFTGVQHLEQE